MSYHGHGMGLTMNATLLQQPAPTTQQSLLTQQSKMLLAVSSPTATLISPTTAVTTQTAPAPAPPSQTASMVLRAAPTATHEPAGTPPVDETVLVDSEIVAPEELAQSFVEEQVPASWVQQPPVSQPLVANGERKIPWLWIGLGVAGLAGAAWWMMRKK